MWGRWRSACPSGVQRPRRGRPDGRRWTDAHLRYEPSRRMQRQYEWGAVEGATGRELEPGAEGRRGAGLARHRPRASGRVGPPRSTPVRTSRSRVARPTAPTGAGWTWRAAAKTPAGGAGSMRPMAARLPRGSPARAKPRVEVRAMSAVDTAGSCAVIRFAAIQEAAPHSGTFAPSGHGRRIPAGADRCARRRRRGGGELVRTSSSASLTVVGTPGAAAVGGCWLGRQVRHPVCARAGRGRSPGTPDR
jgi:hypothetical protein